MRPKEEEMKEESGNKKIIETARGEKEKRNPRTKISWKRREERKRNLGNRENG